MELLHENNLTTLTSSVIPCVQGVIFVVSPSTAVSSHRSPASTGTSRDSCGVEGHDKRDTPWHWEGLDWWSNTQCYCSCLGVEVASYSRNAC
jgi:hypothetical protein